MRQTGDTKFMDLLNNSRFCDDTTSQLGILYERKRVALTAELEDSATVSTFPTEKLVDRYNAKIFDELTKSRRMYIINSADWLLWQQMATFQYLW